MKCLCSGEHGRRAAMADFSAGDCSSQHIEEAESSLRDGDCLNFEEARALLGRMEYNQGNFEAALHVFEGIDVPALIPKMILAISTAAQDQKHRAGDMNSVFPLSMRAVSLLFEAIFLKAKSLELLGRFTEAAQACGTLLGILESVYPRGLPSNFSLECKLQDTLSRAVELLPELWKVSGFEQEGISSYRRALLFNWDLHAETVTRMQKNFAIFLLHGGVSANPPALYVQTDVSYTPRNNLEEAILLLMILLRKTEWDPSIFDHLVFALSVCGGLKALAGLLEELQPGVVPREVRNYFLALCYYGEGEHLVALNILKGTLSPGEDPVCLKSLLLASKICGDLSSNAEEGSSFARRAIAELGTGSESTAGLANLLLGVCLSTCSMASSSDSSRLMLQRESLAAVERADRKVMDDPTIVYQLSLENAVQRKLEAALYNAKRLVKIEAGSSLKSWVLLGRILSAKKQFFDAVEVVDAALNETAIREQAELLKLKARILAAHGKPKSAVDTYRLLLAIVQGKQGESERRIEAEVWYDLANVYARFSQWNDAETCLSKLENLKSISALIWHARGQVLEAKGLKEEALVAYRNGLETDQSHVPSLISTCVMLRKLGNRSIFLAKGLLGRSSS
ncbi:no pollen germination related 2 isoform X3 [Wolffia australiana]